MHHPFLQGPSPHWEAEEEEEAAKRITLSFGPSLVAGDIIYLG
jgi:hypothetical protein